MVHRGQHREHADAVADEVRGVLGDHHALAEGGGQEGLKTFQHGRVGGPGRDQLGQMHVARRVEEVHPAEAVTQFLGQYLGQLVDAQARGVAGQHRVRGDERRDLLVKILLPVHPLGDGLDDEIAAAQLFEAGFVVGGDQPLAQRLAGERGRAQLAEVGDGFLDDTVRVVLLRRQIKQHRVDARIDQVGGDLGTHDARTEDRNPTNR